MSILPQAGDRLSLNRMYIWTVVISLVALFALMASQGRGWTAAVGFGVSVFIASFASGAVLGFIFGVPRVLSSGDSGGSEVDSTNEQTTKQRKLLRSNTNLERISDWLTTMLVGVGLSQLLNINNALVSFRQFVASTATVFSADDGTLHAGILPAAAPLVLIFGAVAGFLIMYLYTRTSLVRLLNAVEKDLLGESERRVVQQAADKLAQETGSFVAEKVSRRGAASVEDALSLMFNALYRPNGYKEVIELAGQLLNTSISTRAEFWFYLAAAFGQQLKSRPEDDKAGREADRANALDSARRAVALDASMKSRLRHIADPSGSERDLEALWTDPDFRQLIGS